MGWLPVLQSWNCSFKETLGSLPGAAGSWRGVLHDFWPLNFCWYFLSATMVPNGPQNHPRGSHRDTHPRQLSVVMELQMEMQKWWHTKPSFWGLEGFPRYLLCSTLRTVSSYMLLGTTFSWFFTNLISKRGPGGGPKNHFCNYFFYAASFGGNWGARGPQTPPMTTKMTPKLITKLCLRVPQWLPKYSQISPLTQGTNRSIVPLDQFCQSCQCRQSCPTCQTFQTH